MGKKRKNQDDNKNGEKMNMLKLSLSTLSTHAMDERKQDMLTLRMAYRIMMGKEDKKV